jgi:hypothetical protein
LTISWCRTLQRRPPPLKWRPPISHPRSSIIRCAYVWAAAHGMTRGIGFDPELLYVAALFHDLGLVSAFDSQAVSFEEADGHVAWRK